MTARAQRSAATAGALQRRRISGHGPAGRGLCVDGRIGTSQHGTRRRISRLSGVRDAGAFERAAAAGRAGHGRRRRGRCPSDDDRPLSVEEHGPSALVLGDEVRAGGSCPPHRFPDATGDRTPVDKPGSAVPCLTSCGRRTWPADVCGPGAGGRSAGDALTIKHGRAPTAAELATLSTKIDTLIATVGTEPAPVPVPAA